MPDRGSTVDELGEVSEEQPIHRLGTRTNHLGKMI